MGGFRAFLTQSNALALAIGVVIGVALGTVVMTLVNAIIMPPIGWALGSIDFASIKTVLGTNAKGEEVAIGMLRDERTTLREPFDGFSLTRFDGSRVTI